MTPEELNVEFSLGPDSLRQEGVPAGRVEKFSFNQSRIFPGTVRDGWIYVPTQYDPAVPACVFVVQDGDDHLREDRRWRIPTILDNLIHQKAIPVMIGIFINPGIVPSTVEGGPERSNRSFEYDSPGDRYARFLTDEIIPLVKQRYHLTTDSNGWSIMGGSSGAFCSFNVAWERPDVFQRVLSIVGSYTAMRGGHTMAAQVRLTEPKPLRVFLESGNDDLEVFAGHWWMGNQDMLGALSYAGYEVDHSWARHAGHNDYHGSMIFPDALRWLWQDYPKTISAGAGSRQAVSRVRVVGEGWIAVPGLPAGAALLASDALGNVYIANQAAARIDRIASDGTVSIAAENTAGIDALAVRPDGSLIAGFSKKRSVVTIAADGTSNEFCAGIAPAALAPAPGGAIYVADARRAVIWVVGVDGKRRRAAKLPAGALAASSDGSTLIATEASTRTGHWFGIRGDGKLANAAPFYRFNAWVDDSDGIATSVAFTRAGWPMFATPAGIQLADRNGLIAGMLSLPTKNRTLSIALGGTDGTLLYLHDGETLYRRCINVPDNLWC